MSEPLVTKAKEIKKVKEGMQLMLEGLKEEFGLDITDHNFAETPERVARSFAEIFSGINKLEQIQEEILSTAFKSDYDGIVLVDKIRCYSMCPHHFLPVEYIVDVAYIGEDKVGLSKLPRVVETLAHQPILQESFTQDIVTCLQSIKPKGTFVRVKGKHSCMSVRGVKQGDCWTYTSSVSGVFENQVTRNEALSMMSNK